MTDLRASLLEAAYRLFTEAGYRGASIRCLAERCRCNVASVYYHFGSKEKLFAEVFAAHSPLAAVADAILGNPPPPGLSPEEALRYVARTGLRAVTSNLPSYYLIFIDIREFRGENLRNELGRRMQLAANATPNPIGELLGRLPLRPGLDPAAFIRHLMVSVLMVALGDYFGFLPTFGAGGQLTMARQPDAEEALDQVCETLLHGALRRTDP